MKKLVVSLVAAMLTIGTCLAGNVKVLKTEYTGADYNLSGPLVTVNVKLQASNVASEECACFVLLKNDKWDDSNMTIPKLSKLCKQMCVGEAELSPVSSTKTIDVPIEIALERQHMTGKDTLFYMKTFVVDFTKEAIIAQGEMIKFSPNTEEARNQMYSRAGEMAGSLLGALFSGAGGGGSNIPEGYKKCNECDGKGVYWLRNSDGTNDRQVNCRECRGKGYVEKDIWDMGEDRLNKSISNDAKQMKGNKKQQQTEDDDAGGLFDLFGF
jgi:hypothetical protein